MRNLMIMLMLLLTVALLAVPARAGSLDNPTLIVAALSARQTPMAFTPAFASLLPTLTPVRIRTPQRSLAHNPYCWWSCVGCGWWCYLSIGDCGELVCPDPPPQEDGAAAKKKL